MYKVFVRNFWKHNSAWPNGLEPAPRARRTTIATRIQTEDAARTIARHWNASHPPGRLSRKAEYAET